MPSKFEVYNIKMKTVVVYLTAIALSAHCFGLQTQGGQTAHIGQYPWVARLELFNTEVVVFCDGSLISDRFVLSAAHCVIENPNNIKVYLGEYDTTTFPEDCEGNQCIENQLVIADKFVWHADYDRHTISNDIALLRLANRATLSAYIQPISLAPFDIDNEANANAPLTVIGWGRTRSFKRSAILQTAEIYFIPKGQCEKINPFLLIPPGHFCAGEKTGINSCSGDSGGPLLMLYNNQYYLSGIVSFGPKVECGMSLTSAFTNVFKYKDWIEHNMELMR